MGREATGGLPAVPHWYVDEAPNPQRAGIADRRKDLEIQRGSRRRQRHTGDRLHPYNTDVLLSLSPAHAAMDDPATTTFYNTDCVAKDLT